MKKLIFALFFLIFACNSNLEKLKEFDFYGKSVSVPAYLEIENKKIGSNFCKNDIFLKDKEKTIFASFELCNYTFGKRPNFNLLEKYFNEDFKVLEEEIPELLWIDKRFIDKGNYYECIYEYKVDNKIYHLASFAYENYFLSIKINSNSKNQVKEITESIDAIHDKDFLNNVVVPDSKEGNCLSCDFPASW